MASVSALLDFESNPRAERPSPVTPTMAVLSNPQLAGGAFAGLAPPAREALSARAALRELSRGAVLAREGSLPAGLFVVVSGRLRAVRRRDNGREMTIETFQPGDVLADAWLAPEQPLSNAWEAAEQTSLLILPRDALVAELERVPELGAALCRQLSRRLAHAQDLAVGLALSDVEGRVVSALLTLGQQDASQSGPPAPEGSYFIRQRPTQQELANRIGACRETVSRVVSTLTRKGLLTPQGRGLLVSKRLAASGR